MADPEISGSDPSERSVWQAMARGGLKRCPACGRGQIFRAYLKVVDRCGACGEDLTHQRADDAPAYFTMVVVGHVMVGGVLALERAIAPEMWIHMVLWIPLTIAMSLELLPRIKGGLVGLQWALRMHGFEGEVPPVPRPRQHD